jgi:hypothetical protein
MSNLVDTGTITFDYPYDNTATTSIPDNGFEGYLEDLGFGGDILNNDLVFIHRIENMTNLFLNNIPEDIYSMEGLKEFKLLRDLRCNGHEISNLDVSCNLNLELLWCHNNPINQIDVSNNVNLKWLNTNFMNLTSLDVSHNKNLEILLVGVNNITSLDVSQNINLIRLGLGYNNIEYLDISTNLELENLNCENSLLTSLDTSYNTNLKEIDIRESFISELDLSNNLLLERLIGYDTQITDLDLSNNINLKDIIVYNNQFNSLNIKNGNNENIETLLTFDNPNLFCIEVDDVEYANNASGWNVDDWTSFSEDCSFSINDISLDDEVSLYPNPVSTTLTLDNSSNTQITFIKIYDVLGRLVFQKDEQFNSIDVSQLTSGLLFVIIETEQGRITKKVVKQ